MEELQWQQQLMRSRCSNLKKVTAIEPRVAQVRHVADVDSCTHQENVQHGANIVTGVEIKIISAHIVGPGAGAGVGDMHQRTWRTDPEVDLPPKVLTT